MSRGLTDAAADAEPWGVRPPGGTARSVRGHLWIFTAALAAPILAFVGLLLWHIATTERTRLEGDARDAVRSVAVAIDRDTTGLLASLDLLSLSAYLKSGDLEGFYRQGEELVRRQAIVPVLTDMEGRQVVNLRVPFGTPLPTTNMPLDKAAIAAGRPFVTDLFVGLVSKEPLFSVATPILEAGKAIYVLSFSLPVERLRRLIADADVPDGYTVAIVDRAGIIMARSQRHDEFVGRPASQALRDNTAGRTGTWAGTTADGAQVFGAYERSRLTDFRAAAGIRFADLNAPLWRSLSVFAALGAAIVGLSLLLGLVFGRRITAPMRALTAAAAALGRGDPVAAQATGLREADEVGREIAAASRSLRVREAELRDANEEIQRFAYIVSHDLRSPLVNIMGFTSELEALRDDTFRRLEALRSEEALAERNGDRQLREDIDEAITFIKASIGKMDRLINAILKLSREGRRQFRNEPVDMEALLAGIAASVAHQADVAGATVSASSLPVAVSDRLALEQVFSNLIDNAIKYLRRDVPGRIDVSGRVAGSRVIYEVRDNGRGIEARDVERVFELFRRSGVQDRPGEGIGLAHVRALLRRLGGTITLTSQPGQGSTFTVTLPARPSGLAERTAA